jgi:excisionase family DNA binding protein
MTGAISWRVVSGSWGGVIVPPVRVICSLYYAKCSSLSFGWFGVADSELLTVGEAAAIFRVTLQTVRNWIEWGKLPALRVGRRFLIRREHIDALLEQAQADDGAHATGRDVWDPTVSRLVARQTLPSVASVWDDASADAPVLPLKQA